MFRRTGKNHFDEVQTLYNEDSTSQTSYTYPRADLLDPTQAIFEHTKSVEARPLSSSVAASATEWSSAEDTLPDFNEEPETTLGEGVTFKGELAFERLLRIDGTFEGILISNGKIIVGPKGSVKADIQMHEAIIEGVVEGNITVDGRVELRGEAVIKGDIQASELCVDAGVKLLGYVAISGITQDQG
ncbi:polymer-forming cytoskeletal family protein [Chlamydia ibidis]|uniref:Polymer-forming cytoskeletal family protein n=2 Tax=Chlamydia ibidis TaxID=1405396 RepID=S7KKS7_9CHLA|nr:polymer-forming cytoskeletal protein [Chlamydia ibidis]EPP35050.1 polymer-forming cytoskeletal family protein [Chlamydia ibidis]EQM62728.1 polymer-forming cytoskeletal family protein [Chlamydia ibidis 10-1398/6]